MSAQDQLRLQRDRVLKLRTTAAGIAAVDEVADAEQRTRSDMARILIAEAIAARQRRRA